MALSNQLSLSHQFRLAACGLALSGLIGSGTGLASMTAAEPLVLREASGSVEQQGEGPSSAWQLAAPGVSVAQGLRVGTGRALLIVGGSDSGSGSGNDSGSGQVLLGSDSALRVFQQEPDFQSGRVYLSGKLKFFAQSVHMAAEGKIRLDLSAPTRRLAVIAGEARLAVGTTQIKLKAGQQYDFVSKKVTPFLERDPWYDSRFTGQGEARIEATNGPVTLQIGSEAARTALPSQPLLSGQQLLTGEGAWAEVGFTGGGYLRLQPRSALSVLSIETVAGEGGKPQRQVSLKLLRGSAWNVVAKGQGGYQLSTPTVTTAVRGTVFRVDDSGLVKVFGGQVALPSQGDTLLASGTQRGLSGQLQPLVTDASDRANQALDAARAAPTRLSLKLPSSLRLLSLSARSQPGAQVKLELSGPLGSVTDSVAARSTLTLPLVGDAQGEFSLQQPGAALPEGRYELKLSATRIAGTSTLRRSLVIDRSAPTLSLTATRLGRTLRLSGQLSDALSRAVVLIAEVDGVPYRRRLSLSSPASTESPEQTSSDKNSATLDWVLPLPRPDAVVSLTMTDEAGNVGYATR